MPDKIKILKSQDESNQQAMFYCPGCRYHHSFTIKDRNPNRVWTWNNNLVSPTFNPSLLVNDSYPELRCHLYVTQGEIIYLNDCHHELRNQTVPMLDYEETKNLWN